MRKNETALTVGPSWLFTGKAVISARPEERQQVRYGLWEVDGLFCRVEFSGASENVYLSTGGMW